MRILTIAATSLFLAGCQEALPDYHGRLKTELVPVVNETVLKELWLELVPEKESSRLDLPLSPGDQVFSAVWELPVEGKLRILLVEPTEEEGYIYADVDLDGELSGPEAFQFAPIENDGLSDGEILLQLPIPVADYSHSPFFLRRITLDAAANTWLAENRKRFLGVSVTHAVEGLVQVEDSEMLVRFGSSDVDIRNGWMGLDGNSDGVVDTNPWSPEWTYAREESVIFRGATDRYLSIKEADTKRKTLVLKEHYPAEYQRIELRTGDRFPEFEFTNFDGKRQTLSEFQGKFLLLDFWHTRCPPCVAAMPHLKAAEERFGSGSFTILGMNHEFTDDLEDGLKRARRFVAEHELTWVQASTESIQQLALERLRISSWPTYILLDPSAKIISFSPGPTDLPLIAGEELIRTLGELLE